MGKWATRAQTHACAARAPLRSLLSAAVVSPRWCTRLAACGLAGGQVGDRRPKLIKKEEDDDDHDDHDDDHDEDGKNGTSRVPVLMTLSSADTTQHPAPGTRSRRRA